MPLFKRVTHSPASTLDSPVCTLKIKRQTVTVICAKSGSHYHPLLLLPSPPANWMHGLLPSWSADVCYHINKRQLAKILLCPCASMEVFCRY